jgi:hypothetical protein
VERARRGGAASRAGYVAAIVANLVLLYVFNNLLNWGVPFLTDSFAAVVVFFNWSFVATIVANAAFLFYDGRWFGHLARMAINVFGFVAVLALFTIFPFDFPVGAWDIVGRIVLVLAMVGIAIGTIVELVKLILNRD